MSQNERLYKIQGWLRGGQSVGTQFLMHTLEVSHATLKRDIAYLRDRYDTPVVWDRETAGYRLDPTANGQQQYELPGMWFNADEVHALLTMQHLLANLDTGGLLGPNIEPLRERLHQLVANSTPNREDVARRIKVQTVGARQVHLPHFQAVGTALLQRQRLRIGYRSRSHDRATERTVSPQRLVHYRDNWYLDAWCHLRQALRSFSVDAILSVQVVDQTATDVPDAELDAVLGSGYGIFAGRQVLWAHLRFSPERARWVAAETWHPQQQGQWDAAGHYLLTLPYADPRELVMDILRHVPHVQVLGPVGLRDAVLGCLQNGLGVMASGSCPEPAEREDATHVPQPGGLHQPLTPPP